MDKHIIENMKQALINLEKQTQHTVDMMKDNKTAEQNKYSPTELSNYDNHPAEMATELFQVEFNSALKVHEEGLLTEIRDAIGRMDNGDYGKCEFCGMQISTERLEALPYVRLCIDCEESKTKDPKILAHQRPNEELVIDSAFGRKYLNKREDDENEGLDYLNDLVKYGSSDTPQDMGGYNDYEEFYTNKIDRQGLVDRMDGISNEDYKRQLPD